MNFVSALGNIFSGRKVRHYAKMEGVRNRKDSFTDQDIPSVDVFLAHGTEFIIPDKTVAGIPLNSKGVNKLGRLQDDFKWSKIKPTCLTFWNKFFFRIWYSFIEALWIPAFRPEWKEILDRNKAYRERQQKRKDKKKRKRSPGVLTSDDNSIAEIEESETFLEESETELDKEEQGKIAHYLRAHQPHDTAGCEILRFNIAGLVYETQRRTLDGFPDTLLGNAERRKRYWDPYRNEFFFDRHRKSFEAILYYFQTRGVLVRPPDVSIAVFEDELKFYDLGPSVVTDFLKEEGINSSEDLPKRMPKNLLLRKLWFLIEYPESSPQAQFIALFSTFVVLLSTIIFCLETVPRFSGDSGDGMKSSRFKDPLSLCEAVCVSWFSLEYFVRLIACPEKAQFMKSPLNAMDFLSICPFYISLIASSGQGEDNKDGRQIQAASQTLVALKIFRLFRVFRVFKLSRHSAGLQVLGKTLRASVRELQLLVFFLIVCVIIFSSLMYYAEVNEPMGQFTSIPDAFWWGVVTMTSLGYGDQVPRGLTGKIVCSFCAVAAVLTLALPIPIFVSNFNHFYKRETEEEGRRELGKHKHVEGCWYLPECPLLAGNENLDAVDTKVKKKQGPVGFKEVGLEERRKKLSSRFVAPQGQRNSRAKSIEATQHNEEVSSNAPEEKRHLKRSKTTTPHTAPAPANTTKQIKNS